MNFTNFLLLHFKGAFFIPRIPSAGKPRCPPGNVHSIMSSTVLLFTNLNLFWFRSSPIFNNLFANNVFFAKKLNISFSLWIPIKPLSAFDYFPKQWVTLLEKQKRNVLKVWFSTPFPIWIKASMKHLLFARWIDFPHIRYYSFEKSKEIKHSKQTKLYFDSMFSSIFSFYIFTAY